MDRAYFLCKKRGEEKFLADKIFGFIALAVRLGIISKDYGRFNLVPYIKQIATDPDLQKKEAYLIFYKKENGDFDFQVVLVSDKPKGGLEIFSHSDLQNWWNNKAKIFEPLTFSKS